MDASSRGKLIHKLANLMKRDRVYLAVSQLCDNLFYIHFNFYSAQLSTLFSRVWKRLIMESRMQ